MSGKRYSNDNDSFDSTLSLDRGKDNNINILNKIHKQKFENFKNIVLGHLDMNSLRNKFIFVQAIIRDFDMFLISESKIGNTFPNNQFKTGFEFKKCFGLIETNMKGS